MSLLDRLRGSGDKLGSPSPGLHPYERRDKVGGRVRLHLRVEPDGRGLLVVNASRVLHLNRTAAEYTWFALEGVSEEAVVREVRRRYQVDAETAGADFRHMQNQLKTLVRGEVESGHCPIMGLDVERVDPFSVDVTAPYRMDLALTYRCNNACPHCYVERPVDYPELGTDAWKAILERVWDESIPHVCFTGGEATLRDDLVTLVAYADEVGLVAGLLTNGRRLSDEDYMQALEAAGLDHVQITLESHNGRIHDAMVAAPGAWQQTVRGIRNAVATGLYVTTNTTLTRDNVADIEDTVAFIASLGVPTFACNSLIYAGRGATVGTGFREGELAPILERVRRMADRHGLRLIWYTPTQYCALSPLQLELGVKACTAALYNMCVEPDGAVIPCQSYYEPLGYILRDPWETIWNHDLALALRERRYAPAKCRECPEFTLCGGGCPLYLDHHAEEAGGDN